MEMLKIMDIDRESIISEILENFPEAMPKFQELVCTASAVHLLPQRALSRLAPPMALTLMSSLLSSRLTFCPCNKRAAKKPENRLFCLYGVL